MTIQLHKLCLFGAASFCYFSITKVSIRNAKVSKHCLSKNCNAKVSIANFSVPIKLSLGLDLSDDASLLFSKQALPTLPNKKKLL